MTIPLQIPTGPVISFQAIPYPLPTSTQSRLQSMARDIQVARNNGEDSPRLRAAVLALNVTELNIRDAIGVEFSRPSYRTLGQC